VLVVAECTNIREQASEDDERNEDSGQNETTARTTDAIPAAMFGVAPDEDAIIKLHEPNCDSSLITATRGNRTTSYHHEFAIVLLKTGDGITHRRPRERR
jgi:hypothetical protein